MGGVEGEQREAAGEWPAAKNPLKFTARFPERKAAGERRDVVRSGGDRHGLGAEWGLASPRERAAGADQRQSSNSTSKMSVALPGILGGEPFSP